VSQEDYSSIALGPERLIQAANEVAAPKKRASLIVSAVLLVALIATTAMWLTTKSSLSDTQSQLASAQDQLATANASLAADQAAAASKQAALDAVPNLVVVAAKYFKGGSGDASSYQLNISGTQIFTLTTPLKSMLSELGFSSAVFDRMQATRALDGTLTAQGKNCNVSWTYHPDDGLNMVFETSH
jgi:hypothetical protein